MYLPVELGSDYVLWRHVPKQGLPLLLVAVAGAVRAIAPRRLGAGTCQLHVQDCHWAPVNEQLKTVRVTEKQKW